MHIGVPAPPPDEDDDGLLALTRFTRRAAGADYIVAFEAGADGIAVPLSADPGTVPQPFALGPTRLHNAYWPDGVHDAEQLRLPSAVLAGLDWPPEKALFLAVPTEDAPASGVLMLYAANAPRQCTCPFRDGLGHSLPMLTKIFSQMLAARRGKLQRRLLSERFHDLFESVSTGIVVVDGDGGTALVNSRAAALLGAPDGEIPAPLLAQRMRALRERCANATDLERTYAPLQSQLGYATITVWNLGEQRIEVDTHPIRGAGQSGRIWLFHDVTAQRRTEEKLRLMAGSDPLTGLPNRRRFEALAQSELDHALAARRPLSILMLDIDHFKSVNDQHGHLAGDRVLREVAQRCQGAAREGDVVARLGGEEFAVVLPGIEGQAAIAVAHRIRDAVAASPVMTDGAAVDVRLSIGGAERRPEERLLDPILKRADHALYAAKRGGRDRVVWHTASDTAGAESTATG